MKLGIPIDQELKLSNHVGQFQSFLVLNPNVKLTFGYNFPLRRKMFDGGDGLRVHSFQMGGVLANET